MFFMDESGRPLPEGTVLRDPETHHTGLIAYDQIGRQIALHLSKRLGRAVASPPEEMNDGIRPMVVDRYPQTPEEGSRAVQHAWAEVQRGVRWTWFNNCQDFVSRAYKGQSGSPTRDLIFGGLCVVGLLFAVANSK